MCYSTENEEKQKRSVGLGCLTCLLKSRYKGKKRNTEKEEPGIKLEANKENNESIKKSEGNAEREEKINKRAQKIFKEKKRTQRMKRKAEK